MEQNQKEDHDHGLAYDLEIISQKMVARRNALSWLAGVGAAALMTGCGGGGSDTSSSSSTTSSTSTTSTSSSSSSSCIADAAETGGPYPADGTNSSSGSTSNVLTASGIVRSDIRSSFISSTTTAQGVQLTLTLTLVNANNNCAPLSGYAIYLWHCTRDGQYSLYTDPTESYLRGVQVTDANGQVTFTTIFPGCYSGRWPHIHFEVYSSLAVASVGANAKLVSQLAMPSAICSTVYNNASGYSSSVTSFASVSISSDNVFGDNTSAQIAQMTPSISGSVSAGYTATNTIGVSV